MLYQLEQGPLESKILDNVVRFKLPIPDKIANAPDLEIGLDLYWNAFATLTTSRQVGMGMGPISWESMIGYCVINEIEGEQRDDLIYLLNKMDGEYLKQSSKKAPKTES